MRISDWISDFFSSDLGGFYTLLIDKNGYCPTHNTLYSRQPTGDLDHDTRHVRNKRIFDDPVSLGAAGNEAGVLCQTYMRDTGEIVTEIGRASCRERVCQYV